MSEQEKSHEDQLRSLAVKTMESSYYSDEERDDRNWIKDHPVLSKLWPGQHGWLVGFLVGSRAVCADRDATIAALRGLAKEGS